MILCFKVGDNAESVLNSDGSSCWDQNPACFEAVLVNISGKCLGSITLKYFQCSDINSVRLNTQHGVSMVKNNC